MPFEFTQTQCFFVVALAFMIVGFQRGWRRELISLVFVLLAAFLIQPTSSGGFLAFIEQRLPGAITFLITGQSNAAPSQAVTQQAIALGAWGPLLGFAIAMALGYYVGNKAFPAKPAAPAERIIGVIPAVVSAAVVLVYLGAFIPGRTVNLKVSAPDPGQYVAIIFIIALGAAIVALIAARARKPAGGGGPVKK